MSVTVLPAVMLQFAFVIKRQTSLVC